MEKQLPLAVCLSATILLISYSLSGDTKDYSEFSQAHRSFASLQPALWPIAVSIQKLKVRAWKERCLEGTLVSLKCPNSRVTSKQYCTPSPASPVPRSGSQHRSLSQPLGLFHQKLNKPVICFQISSLWLWCVGHGD